MNLYKTILLVEDDEDDRFFFTDAVSKIQNAVLQYAKNGEEALEKLKSQTLLPDIIFMDINMPRMNGIECLTEIVRNSKLKGIPVVMLSSSTEEMEVARSIGAKAFIKKPNSSSVLCAKISQMVNLDFTAESDVANGSFERVMM